MRVCILQSVTSLHVSLLSDSSPSLCRLWQTFPECFVTSGASHSRGMVWCGLETGSQGLHIGHHWAGPQRWPREVLPCDAAEVAECQTRLRRLSEDVGCPSTSCAECCGLSGQCLHQEGDPQLEGGGGGTNGAGTSWKWVHACVCLFMLCAVMEQGQPAVCDFVCSMLLQHHNYYS